MATHCFCPTFMVWKNIFQQYLLMLTLKLKFETSVPQFSPNLQINYVLKLSLLFMMQSLQLPTQKLSQQERFTDSTQVTDWGRATPPWAQKRCLSSLQRPVLVFHTQGSLPASIHLWIEQLNSESFKTNKRTKGLCTCPVQFISILPHKDKFLFSEVARKVKQNRNRLHGIRDKLKLDCFQSSCKTKTASLYNFLLQVTEISSEVAFLERGVEEGFCHHESENNHHKQGWHKNRFPCYLTE